jgi:hypothetical protein
MTAVSMTAAFTAAVTSSASAAPAALAKPAGVGSDCYDANGYNGAVGFWRCTGTSPSSPLVWSTCNQGEYNAGSSYNVYWWLSQCNTRVWLHEYKYPTDVTSGWAVCATPGGSAGSSGVMPSGDEHPQNIQVTANTSAC